MCKWKVNTRVCKLFTLNWGAFAEKKNISWDKRKDNIYIWKNKISELCTDVLKIMLWLCFNKHLYECFFTFQSEKKHTWNWSKILGIFLKFVLFFINFFMKTLIKSIIYCQNTVPLWTIYLCILQKSYVRILCLHS